MFLRALSWSIPGMYFSHNKKGHYKKKKQSAKLKTKWMMVGKKTFAKRIVLEKIAFGYVLIEKGKLFSWGGRKKKEKISKGFAIKMHSFIRKSLRSNLGHQAFLHLRRSKISYACIEVVNMCRQRFCWRLYQCSLALAVFCFEKN